MTASCLTACKHPPEAKAIDNLRAMTRAASCSEDVVAPIESQFPRSKARPLARLVRARIRIAERISPALLNYLHQHRGVITVRLGTMLFMRADALGQAGNKAEARASYDNCCVIIRSFRAREAALRAAEYCVASGRRCDSSGIVTSWLRKTTLGRCC